MISLPKPKRIRLWSYDEMLAKLPETNLPIELWDGELVASAPRTPEHQSVVGQACVFLHDFVSDRKLGRVFISPLDVVLSQHRVVQPDVLFIARSNKGIIQDRIHGVPDLVMEVISPGSWQRDRVEKKGLYEQFEVPEYWIIDSETGSIEVFALVKGQYQLHCRATGKQSAKSKLLTGFSVTFRKLQGSAE